jgi:hypothetical protein
MRKVVYSQKIEKKPMKVESSNKMMKRADKGCLRY